MKKIEKILILMAFALFVIACTTNVYAGEQEWNALDYNVVLNEDGSADIVETWDVDISETNTMFKDFDLSSDGTYYIDDVKVTKVQNGVEYPLEQIYEEQYHVDSGCYYGLMIDNNTFEIAWNVGLDDSSDTRTYKIYYTVENAVKVYSDCAEFYWQFIGNDNTMTGNNITGTITLPSGITDIERLHIWGHGDFSGNTERTSTNTLKFNMNHLYSNSMIEIRVVVEDNIFETCSNIYYQDKLSSILEEEATWAEQANAQKAMYKKIVICTVIIIAVIFIIYLRKIIKYSQAGKELKMNSYPKNELQYFRDIPNEGNATPARAAFMYYFNTVSSGFENHTSNIFSATLLQLTLKKKISLEPIDKNNVRIYILDGNADSLTREERLIYNLLVDNMDRETNSVDTKTLEKYAKNHYDEFYDLMKDVCKAAEEYEENRGAIDKERKKASRKWSRKGILYVLASFFLGFMLSPLILVSFPILIEFIICAVKCFSNAKKINALSPVAYEEMNQWKALKNYMSDFSLLKEKEVPDLILWEKYLVYATVFGISKKVLDQLVEVYPQMTSEEYYRTGHYTYLYMASNSGFDSLSNLDKSFSDICRTANSAYSAAHSSSSGGGGGFSGGSGGRRWRPEAAVVDNLA